MPQHTPWQFSSALVERQVELDLGAMAEPDEVGLGSNVVTEFATYEDYLDSQISEIDMYYLEDEDLARQLVELGYRGSGETLDGFGAERLHDPLPSRSGDGSREVARRP